MKIVRYEAALHQSHGIDQGKERGDVLGLGPFADHDLHAAMKLFSCLCQPGAFVIGTDTGADIGIDSFPFAALIRAASFFTISGENVTEPP